MRSRRAGIEQAEPRRRGAVLVLFVLLTFAFFAVAAVVFDVGIASLAQTQMQVATDSAALEGCRWRNFDEGLGFSNLEKRRKVATMVRLTFDDDLHPTRGGYVADNQDSAYPTSGVDGPDEAAISAGPSLRVSGGDGAWATHSIVDEQPESELARIDDPRLQTNNGNQARGDMVAGRYRPEQPHVEPSSYVRPDFTVPAAGLPTFSALSFLVRMRRAGAMNPDDVLNNVSSSLPTLPVVFGLASTILQDPGNDWDPRRDGITVRATSIASARPAMRVGRVPCDEAGAPLYDHEPDVSGTAYRERISGLAPFFIYSSAWETHFRGPGWQAAYNDVNGRVRVEADGRLVLDSSGVLVGHFLFDAASDPGPCGDEVGWPVDLGRAVPMAIAAPVRNFRYTTRKPRYIAIVEPITAPPSTPPVLRVVGYGFAHLWPVGFIPDGVTPPPAGFPGTGTFVISPGELINHVGVDCWIAQDNASAILKSAATATIETSLSAPTLEAVLRASNRLAYGVDEPDPDDLYDYTRIRRGTVLAPALTR